MSPFTLRSPQSPQARRSPSQPSQGSEGSFRNGAAVGFLPAVHGGSVAFLRREHPGAIYAEGYVPAFLVRRKALVLYRAGLTISLIGNVLVSTIPI